MRRSDTPQQFLPKWSVLFVNRRRSGINTYRLKRNAFSWLLISYTGFACYDFELVRGIARADWIDNEAEKIWSQTWRKGTDLPRSEPVVGELKKVSGIMSTIG
jgi:hypothetical protein